MNPQPKPVKWRSEGYKNFIREKPCLKCDSQSRSTFQHENCGYRNLGKGTSTKISDIYGVPLCSTCHAERERYGTDEAVKFWGDKFEDLPFRMMQWLNDYLGGLNK